MLCLQTWKTVNVQHKGEDYVIMFTNIIGQYHTLNHMNTEVVFGALLYGLKYYASYAVPLGIQFGYPEGMFFFVFVFFSILFLQFHKIFGLTFVSQNTEQKEQIVCSTKRSSTNV